MWMHAALDSHPALPRSSMPRRARIFQAVGGLCLTFGLAAFFPSVGPSQQPRATRGLPGKPALHGPYGSGAPGRAGYGMTTPVFGASGGGLPGTASGLTNAGAAIG